MATVLNAATNQVKLANGTTTTAQNGAWYDGQQYVNGSLSASGVINSQSNQQGAGQAVSQAVVAQTNPNNVAYLQQQNPQAAPANPAPAGNGATTMPSTAAGAPLPGSIGATGTNVPNLNALYQNLFNSKGVQAKEDQLASDTDAFNKEQSTVNDNPFLSEGDRTGRVQKLQTDYNNNTAGLQNDIATSKADIQNEVALQTQQFDLNSQAAQQSLAQFNDLLSSGALDNASGSDIAQITASTGLSSQAIQSAIDASKQKSTPTQVETVSDSTGQYAVVINPQTGAVISKTKLADAPAQSAGSAITQQEDQIKLDQEQAPQLATQAAQSGKTFGDMLSFYQQYGLSAQQIYDIYNAANYYGRPADSVDGQPLTAALKKQLGIK